MHIYDIYIYIYMYMYVCIWCIYVHIYTYIYTYIQRNTHIVHVLLVLEPRECSTSTKQALA